MLQKKLSEITFEYDRANRKSYNEPKRSAFDHNAIIIFQI